MYPLRFEPVFRRYLWGGHRLRDALGKPTGDETCAESWEVVDHDDSQSIVAYGSLKGKSLGELVRNHSLELLGKSLAERIDSPGLPAHLRLRFPLLFKFLDASKDLSVQVHPGDEMAATLDPPDLGKTEAWYVIQAEPGAKIYAGLRDGVTKAQFQSAIEEGIAHTMVHSFEPQSGDCVFIEAGTVHAIGAGLLIAEIQQASDTTFRIYDWNRVDKDGNPRPLHIAQGLEATNFDLGPVSSSEPVPMEAGQGEQLVECNKFVLRRHSSSDSRTLGGDDRFRLIVVVEGALEVAGDPADSLLVAGQTALLPACCGAVELRPSPDSRWLEVFVP